MVLLQLARANAHRELGEFDTAGALLPLIEGSGKWPPDEEEREGARVLLTGLQRLVIDRHSHPEPADLIPANVAAERCMDMSASLSPAELTAFAEPAYEEAVAERGRYPAGGNEGGGADAALADLEANMEAAASSASQAIAAAD